MSNRTVLGNGENLTENVVGAEGTFLHSTVSGDGRAVGEIDGGNIRPLHSVMFWIGGVVLVAATHGVVGTGILHQLFTGTLAFHRRGRIEQAAGGGGAGPAAHGGLFETGADLDGAGGHAFRLV